MDFQLSIKDIHFLRPLFWYLNIFLITPWYDFSKKSLVRTNMRIFYTIILVLLKITLLVYSFLDEILEQVHGKLFLTQKIILGSTYTNITLTVIATIFKSGFWNRNLWKEMLSNFCFLDTKLQNQRKRENFFRNFYCKLVLKHVLFGILAHHQLHSWSNFVSAPAWKIIMFTGFMEMCYEFLIVLLLTALVQAFEVRYKDLNERLMKLSRNGTTFQELLSLAQSYRILGETVDIFNELFGYQLVLIIFHCGLQMVQCLNLVFVFGAAETNDDVHFQFLVCNFWLFVWIGVRVHFT